MLGDMMKVKTINEDEIIVFLNKKYFYDLDLENDEKVEEYFRDIFKSLLNNYDIALKGSYTIYFYSDKNYGIILKIIREDEIYYYDNQIDMNINFVNNPFLYKINYSYLDKYLLKYSKLYMYKNEFYLQIKEKIDEIILGKIIEISDIIFEDESLKIITKGREVIL